MYQRSSTEYIRTALIDNNKKHLFTLLSNLSAMIGDRETLIPKFTALQIIDNLDVNAPGIPVIPGLEDEATVPDHYSLESLPYVGRMSGRGYEVYSGILKQDTSFVYYETDKSYGIPPEVLSEYLTLTIPLRSAFLAQYVETYALYLACLESKEDDPILGISDKDMNNLYINNRWLYDRIAMISPRPDSVLTYLNDQVQIIMALKKSGIYSGDMTYGTIVRGWNAHGYN